MSSDKRKLAVLIGVDFGTSRSGFAYSYTGIATRKHILRTTWPGRLDESYYPKTLTQSLYDSDGKLDSWGYEAVRRLAEFKQGRKASGYALLKNFKMDLATQASDQDGPIRRTSETLGGRSREFRVIDLIADYLRKLKTLALQDVRKGTIAALRDDEVLWCLTIPAIWNDLQKRWMRMAAQRAGIIGPTPDDQERLLMVLEPEAAALACWEDESVNLQTGDRFLVLDCGGGTVDITAHEVSDKGLREIAKGNGGPFGSTYIDAEIVKHIRGELSPEALVEFETEHAVEFLSLLEDIERAKCAFGGDPTKTIYLKLPNVLDRLLAKKYPAVLQRLEQKQNDDTQLHLSPETMEAIFEPFVGNIAYKVRETLRDIQPRDHSELKLNYIFMVGGFSESGYLQRRISDLFGGACLKIVVPANPGGAVLRGAVSFGLDPSLIRSRRARLTYGRNVLTPFIKGYHDPAKAKSKPGSGDLYCDKVFSAICKAGEEISLDEVRVVRSTPFNPDQRDMWIQILASKHCDVTYTDDPRVQDLGALTVPMPDLTGRGEREVEITFKFGQTELDIRARDLTSGSEPQPLRLDFSSSYSSDLG